LRGIDRAWAVAGPARESLADQLRFDMLDPLVEGAGFLRHDAARCSTLSTTRSA
jgi:hypothetical protein